MSDKQPVRDHSMIMAAAGLLGQKEQPRRATLKHAKIIREMISHEDDVIDQRFTWLCQIQGFLFAALANLLVLLLCVVGSLVAISSFFALRSAWQGVEKLLNWWGEPSDYFSPDVFARRVNNKKGFESYLRPWKILPLTFGLAWVVIFIIRIWPFICRCS